jgi:RNA polymerase sigma-70 factor (ECF subfamily)
MMLSDEQRERYEKWVLEVGPRALAYARSLIRDAAQAEDVVQECFYRLLRRAAHYDLEKDGVKLLFKAISNLCINQATRGKLLLSLDSTRDPDDDPIPLADPAALQPELILQHQELEESIRQALQTLPTLQRAAVELRALGMSKEEIAETLDVTATHAGVLTHRGRQTLARELAKKLDISNSEERL